ncbi:MAG: mechanosensitive ion channel family protein [Candidatus Sericytochromatia bacterium]|nr:mechanosensitive ion channel family protein [Candidatus Sericytochromatia bacterium]
MPPLGPFPTAASPAAGPPSDLVQLVTGDLPWSASLAHQLGHDALRGLFSISLAAIVTLLGFHLCDRLVGQLFQLLSSRMNAEPGARLTQRMLTASAILRSIGKGTILFVAMVFVLSRLGVDVAPILASAGIVGLAVGFGAQSLVKDVISGFFIVMEDQFGVGDVIDLNGHNGLVERMNLRIVQIRNGQGSLITIPNGQVTTVVNHSKGWARAVVDVTVPTCAEPSLVLSAMRDTAEALARDLGREILEPAELLGVEQLKESEAVLRIQFKTAPLAQWKVARAYRERLWPRLRAIGALKAKGSEASATADSVRGEGPLGAEGAKGDATAFTEGPQGHPAPCPPVPAEGRPEGSEFPKAP